MNKDNAPLKNLSVIMPRQKKVGTIVYMVRETAEKGSEKQCANSVGIMLIKKS